MFNFLKSKDEKIDLALPEDTSSVEKQVADKWQFFAKTYATPNPTANPTLPESVLEKSILGVTTFLWVNSRGEIKKQEVLGSDENPLFDLLDKAMMGLQYVDYRGRKFGIALVPNEPTANIPLR